MGSIPRTRRISVISNTLSSSRRRTVSYTDFVRAVAVAAGLRRRWILPFSGRLLIALVRGGRVAQIGMAGPPRGGPVHCLETSPDSARDRSGRAGTGGIILAFSAASTLRLVRFVMIRSRLATERSACNYAPSLRFGVHFTLHRLQSPNVSVRRSTQMH